VVTAQEALSLGMVDRIDTLEGTVARMARQRSPARPAPPRRMDGASTRLLQFQKTSPTTSPAPKEESEEERARIGRLVSAAPHAPTRQGVSV
jgi:ClpP class serine protease